MIRCLITDGTYEQRPGAWLEHVAHWIRASVELLQIRERDLSTRELAKLTRTVMKLVGANSTKVLVNDRADVALACGATGVHLRDGSIAPLLYAEQGLLVTASCHSVNDAGNFAGADYVLLSPIFRPLSKSDDRQLAGVEAIREFTRRSSTPVLALGGITKGNARLCMEAGAAGIAGITYFER